MTVLLTILLTVNLMVNGAGAPSLQRDSNSMSAP